MANASQGIYAPIPQSLSDSDSERELHMESLIRPTGNPTNCNHHDDEDNDFDGTNGSKIYRQQQNGNHSITTNNFIIQDSEMPTIKVKRPTTKPPMSTARKIALTVSIILCFLPAIVFIWVLPCTASQTCPVTISNWESEQPGIELKGAINVVHGAFQKNLALLYEGSVGSTDSLKNGAVSLLGNTGTVAWYF